MVGLTVMRANRMTKRLTFSMWRATLLNYPLFQIILVFSPFATVSVLIAIHTLQDDRISFVYTMAIKSVRGYRLKRFVLIKDVFAR